MSAAEEPKVWWADLAENTPYTRWRYATLDLRRELFKDAYEKHLAVCNEKREPFRIHEREKLAARLARSDVKRKLNALPEWEGVPNPHYEMHQRGRKR